MSPAKYARWRIVTTFYQEVLFNGTESYWHYQTAD